MLGTCTNCLRGAHIRSLDLHARGTTRWQLVRAQYCAHRPALENVLWLCRTPRVPLRHAVHPLVDTARSAHMAARITRGISFGNLKRSRLCNARVLVQFCVDRGDLAGLLGDLGQLRPEIGVLVFLLARVEVG